MFPFQTGQDYEITMELLDRPRFVRVQLFPYKPRPRTIAARLDDHVSIETRQQRMIRAREFCEQLQQRELDRRIGDRVQVLIEKEATEDRGPVAEGLSREGLRVQFDDADGTLRRGVEVDGILDQRRGPKMSATKLAIGSGKERQS